MVGKYKSIFVPTTGPDDWRQLLAEPDKQWKTGCSAKELAYCWEMAEGFPAEVEAVLRSQPEFASLEILFAVPEYKVFLPGGARPSQNDIFVLARNSGGLVVIMVEGKVSEPFGPTLGDWLAETTSGKVKRLSYLRSVLRIRGEISEKMRYQLLHRTASALIVAERFCAKNAVMLVHSFSAESAWFDDYAAFLELYGVTAKTGVLHNVLDESVPNLFCGWVKGVSGGR
ncbi:hypothetical protein N1030_10450 [Desulfovibrio mangrovi]|uniref:DUF6946 family protein n=1 Tax=Desulfovibrio mangrovi TaxID=2976983 RepID=UPI0022476598|nr:hypothetical protein [Desulfovibrio mangrovi]UZP66042.1 hypothetical protein N1030_10450 [Desulfovibrio mangrovi]